MIRFNTIGLNDLAKVAESILKEFPSHKIYIFEGEMGAGKTSFIKAFCQVLDVYDKTSSPTFSIVNVYNTRSQETIYHFDFYRINKSREAIEIGLYDYLSSGSYCFIEWPEKIDGLLDEEVVKITIQSLEQADKRTIEAELLKP